MLSQELTNVRNVPTKKKENKWANATWKKGYIMEIEGELSWDQNRQKRAKTALTYVNTNVSMPYTQPNPNVLKMRLVHENPVWAMITKQDNKNDYVRRFSYYDPVLEGPPKRRVPYSSGVYRLDLM
jgi:hypothetical protein